MNKIWLIIQREFSSRVKKRTFLIMTILGPILFGALMIAPALLANMPEGAKTLVVLDESGLFTGKEGDDLHKLRFLDPRQYSKDQALDLLESKEDLDGLFHVPLSPSGDPDFWKNNASIYGKEDVSLGLEHYFSELLSNAILEHKLLAENVDPKVVANARTSVKLRTYNLSASAEKESATEIKIAVGYASGFLIYIFIFLYAAQIMRGVIEEKTNRIVEILISSVKPFQLMIGKVVGIGLVGVLQFTVWVFLSMIIFQLTSSAFMADALDPEKIATGQQMNETAQMIFDQVKALPVGKILYGFLFFFIGGYFLYGALFAAVGAAVDSETDTQQFMMPLVIPLVLALIVSSNVMENPHSDLAFWFSMIPLTSPIVMMVRIPFDVPGWQLALSMTLLIGGFTFTAWLAGRIYRVGILMYGKKPSYREIWKWIKYRSAH